MKEFEKWDGKQHNEHPCMRVDDISCDACTDLKQEGWKAALEWIKESIYKGHDLVDIWSYISDELDDE